LAILTEADVGPEPPHEPSDDWAIWTAKCAIIRFREQRDGVESMAMIDAEHTLRFFAGEMAAIDFMKIALPRQRFDQRMHSWKLAEEANARRDKRKHHD
jgi:hypothetical protein